MFGTSFKQGLLLLSLQSLSYSLSIFSPSSWSEKLNNLTPAVSNSLNEKLVLGCNAQRVLHKQSLFWVDEVLKNQQNLSGNIADNFEKLILDRYYPRAKPLTNEFFERLTPHELAGVYNKLTDFIDQVPWRYIRDKKSDFASQHLDHLLSELEVYVNFLQQCVVDTNQRLIRIKSSKQAINRIQYCPLLEFWQKNGLIETYYKLLYLIFCLQIRKVAASCLRVYKDKGTYPEFKKQLNIAHKWAALFRNYPKYDQILQKTLVAYQRIGKQLECDTAVFKPAANTSSAIGGGETTRNVENLDFLHSFINAYEFNLSGKFVHEYHPYLLQKASDSLIKLETRLAQEVGKIGGRLVIMGYEENCLPNYFPVADDVAGGLIDDESSFAVNQNWSYKSQNRFGLITGFLLSQSTNPNLTHIGKENQYIFDSSMRLFQQDAFGPQYANIVQCGAQINQNSSELKSVLQTLTEFWDVLYRTELKAGDSNVIGTQDLLFTMANTQYLINSAIGIKNFFLGADLTYPITTNSFLQNKATRNAQTFVKEFVDHLQPQDGKKTAYIFKSFVDGVGKSTLLGNVKNYLQYGFDFKSYQNVDNTSSLFADIFDFVAPGQSSEDSQICIVDLPAQMSHFTFKPDGQVYIPIQTQDLDEVQIDQIRQYFTANYYVLKCQLDTLVIQAQQILDAGQAFPDSYFDTAHPELSFAKNLVVLKQAHTCPWIPFTYQGAHYLGQLASNVELKTCLPLEQAGSFGLKNADPTQMIFSTGLQLPLAYENFLQDLTGRLVSRGVERVVFVDFLSMYSRSSRENIRINYLLQLLFQQNPHLHLEHTLYSNFDSNNHLLYVLNQAKSQKDIFGFLKQEGLTRMALDTLVQSRADATSLKLPEAEVLEIVNQQIEQVLRQPDQEQKVDILIESKLKIELENLSHQYGRTQDFCNIYNFQYSHIVELSAKLQSFFAQKVRNETLNNYFSAFGRSIIDAPHIQEQGSMPEDCELTMDNGYKITPLFCINPESRNAQMIQQFFTWVKPSWYRLIFNLLNAEDGGQLAMEKLIFDEPYCLVFPANNGFIYVVGADQDFQELDQEQLTASPLVEALSQPDLGLPVLNFAYNPKATFSWDNLEYFFKHILETQNLINPGMVLPMPFSLETILGKYRKMLQPILFRMTLQDQKNQKNKDAKLARNKAKYTFLEPKCYAGVAWLIRWWLSIELLMRRSDAIFVIDRKPATLQTAANFFQEFLLPAYAKVLVKDNLNQIGFDCTTLLVDE